MLIRAIVAAVIFYILYRLARLLFSDSGRVTRPLSGGNPASLQGEDLVEDPQCHTYIPLSAAHSLEVDGRTLYFCSRKCLDDYRRQKRSSQEAP
ncbi:MAG TPA: YHS domain-containing protein [Syntrophales bacterium]|nr:YHS domain-containing protein [Syntrophales bacterium]HOM07360.1 YHS domain-containing protein [Syntrophales bacterium]HON98935.1 YHS domain-containing protein [Syntrophales bacterium]HPC00399.1 YHS domain-containing protein [Syntrophales bacterium]HPQ07002.1 YHS domain-containing protein [Syntrophales bacterium]